MAQHSRKMKRTQAFDETAGKIVDVKRLEGKAGP